MCFALIDMEALHHGINTAKNCPIATELVQEALKKLINAVNHIRFELKNEPNPVTKHLGNLHIDANYEAASHDNPSIKKV